MMLKVILSSVPFVWMIIALPFANRVHPYILGMPFLAFLDTARCYRYGILYPCPV